MSSVLRRRSGVRGGLASAAFILTLGVAESLYGDISGQNVVVGNVIFTQTANGWIIKPSNGAIIEYTSFGVNANETIKFIQANANSRVLNRVLGDFPTNIDGRLLANGIVYITNPAGVFIGPNGVVNVGGIYAAAGNMSNADFLGGLDTFTGMKGRIENAGDVTGKSIAAFFGTSVVNSGSIKTGPGGLTAAIASTGTVRLTQAGVDPKVYVDAYIDSDPQVDPNTDVGVLNTGSIKSGVGGQVLLGAGDVYSVAIRNTATSAVRTPSGLVLMKGNIIEQQGLLQGERLTIDAGRLELSEDLQFDRMRINADVTLFDDVAVRGENGGTAEWLYIQGRLSSTANDRHSFASGAAQSVFHMEVGKGAGRLGSLTIDGNAYFGSNVTAQDDISIGGATLFNGNRDQSMRAVDGSVSIGDQFFKLGAMLTISGNGVNLGGNGFAVGDLVIESAPGSQINFNGTGDQRIGSHSRVVVDGDVTKSTSGALYIGAPIIEAGGSISTVAGDLTLFGATNFNGDGDQSAIAGSGTLLLAGSVQKSTAGALTLGGSQINVQNSVTTSAGDLVFQGLTLFAGAGDQSATANGGQLVATNDVTKSTAGNLLLAGEGLALGGNTSTTQGDLTLDGSVEFNGAANQFVAAVGGDLTLTGDALKLTAGDLTLSGETGLNLAGDALVDEGSLELLAPSIALTGSDAQELAASDTVRFEGDLSKALGDLRVTAGNRIDVGGDVALEDGRLRFSGPMLLRIDSSMSAERVRFDGTIDGFYALVVNATDRIEFGGAIGQQKAKKAGDAGLRSLTLTAGNFVEFETNAVRVAETISFNANDATSGPIPDVATIGASGDITFECGEFLMGARQKFTVLGTLVIEAGVGTVTLGDVNMLNDLIVNADQIRLRSRAGGNVRTIDGLRTDSGTDIIAGGIFSFSSIPIVLGGGVVQFASLEGSADANGNLAGFTLSLIDEPFGAATLRQGSLYFDATLPVTLPPAPPISTASPATILAVEETDGAASASDADRTLLRESERIALGRILGPAVNLRRQLPVELERGGAGTVVFDSGEFGEVGRTDGARVDVAVPRLSRDVAVRFLSAHARLETLTATDAARERARAIVAQIEAAVATGGAESVVRDLSTNGTPSDLELVRAIAGTIAWGERIGFSDAERAAAGADGVAFPQSALVRTLELSSCNLTGEAFGDRFWNALQGISIAQR